MKSSNQISAPAKTRTTDYRPAGPPTVDGFQRHDVDLNRSERIGFWIYVASGICCAAVWVAAVISAIVS